MGRRHRPAVGAAAATAMTATATAGRGGSRRQLLRPNFRRSAPEAEEEPDTPAGAIFPSRTPVPLG